MDDMQTRLMADAQFIAKIRDGLGPKVTLLCPRGHPLTVIRLHIVRMGDVAAWFLGSEISERRHRRPAVFATQESALQQCAECGCTFEVVTPGQVTCPLHGALVMNFVNAAFHSKFHCEECGADSVLRPASTWGLYGRAVKDGLKYISLP